MKVVRFSQAQEGREQVDLAEIERQGQILNRHVDMNSLIGKGFRHSSRQKKRH